MFITFGKNPYSTTIKGFIINAWITGVSIIAKEYIRYKLIHNVYEKDKLKIAIAISIVYVLIDFNISRFFYGTITAYYVLKQVAQTLVPLIATNILASYLAMKTNYIPAVIYQIGIKLYLWISPILPNTPWIMVSIIDTVIPIIIMVYIRYYNNKKDIFKSREKMEATNPRHIIPLVAGIILVIWFAIGIFPIKPIAIATGSMKTELWPGDVAIIKKCNSNDVIVGDIIEYQMEGYTVVHRVIEKNQRNGEFFFVTKGDNNKHADAKEVTEQQLIGKVIFKVKFIGYPAIWLNLIRENEAQVEIET